MKLSGSFFILAVFTLICFAGCQKEVPEKKNTPEKTAADEKKTTAERYGSMAVLPFTGDYRENLDMGVPGLAGVPAEKRKEFLENYLENDLSVAVARDIAKKMPSVSFKVIAPAIVKEKRRPEMDLRALGKVLDAKLLLVGKAVPSNHVELQLIVAESGELLWGDKINSVPENIVTYVVRELQSSERKK